MAAIAVFLTLDEPTRPIREEAVAGRHEEASTLSRPPDRHREEIMRLRDRAARLRARRDDASRKLRARRS